LPIGIDQGGTSAYTSDIEKEQVAVIGWHTMICKDQITRI
jgi:hypothetical protein